MIKRVLVFAVWFGHIACQENKNRLHLDVDVKIFQTSSKRILSLQCKSFVPTMVCAVEFVVNEKTIDNLRYNNNTCYHGTGACYPEICTCSADCRVFKLNYTDSAEDDVFLFGCIARFQDKVNVLQRKEVLKYFNSTGSYIYLKDQKPDNGYGLPDTSNTSLTKSAYPPICNQNEGYCLSWIVLLAIETFLFLLLILWDAKRIWRQNIVPKLSRIKLRETDRTYSLDIIEEVNEENTSEFIEDERASLLDNTRTAREENRDEMFQDYQGIQLCDNCKRAPSVICTDCEKRLCKMCSTVHGKFFRTHIMCKINFVFPPKSDIKCKICMTKKASTICYLCNKICCFKCYTKHQHGVDMIIAIDDWNRRLTV